MPVRSDELPLFRHATGVCLRVVGQRAVAGENRAGEPGYAHIVIALGTWDTQFDKPRQRRAGGTAYCRTNS